ncbi:MAG: aspartate aminotransferase family protein [Sulfolobales archaeon]
MESGNIFYSTLRDLYIPKGLGLTHPITIIRGSGEYLYDADGNRYIDLTSGIGVTVLGHSNPELVETAMSSLKNLWHISIMVANYPSYLELARELSEMISISGRKKALFFNSGAEAVENAVKISRAYTGKPYIISFIGAFHGRTTLALSLTGKYKPYKKKFEPLASHVAKAPYPYCYRLNAESEDECINIVMNYLELLVDVDLSPEVIAAAIVEPVQGEGGFIVPPRRFLSELESFLRKRGIMLIVDEIQTGYCRTGRFMAFEHFNIDPDIVTLGKAIANGMPLSSVVGRAGILDSMDPGMMGGTYGGNPIAASVALKVLEIIRREKICEKVERLERIMTRRLEEIAEKYDVVGEHRGLGVMRALEFVKNRRTKEPYPELVSRILEEGRRRGLLLLKAGYYDNVIRFHPPLVIESETLETAMSLFEEALKEAVRGLAHKS